MVATQASVQAGAQTLLQLPTVVAAVPLLLAASAAALLAAAALLTATAASSITGAGGVTAAGGVAITGAGGVATTGAGGVAAASCNTSSAAAAALLASSASLFLATAASFAAVTRAVASSLATAAASLAAVVAGSTFHKGSSTCAAPVRGSVTSGAWPTTLLAAATASLASGLTGATALASPSSLPSSSGWLSGNDLSKCHDLDRPIIELFQSSTWAGQQVASSLPPSVYGSRCLNRPSTLDDGHTFSALRTKWSMGSQGGGLKGNRLSQCCRISVIFATQSGLASTRLTSSEGSAVMLNRKACSPQSRSFQ
mmetsp:Transcript_24419/g.58505  ORF Transcript_24419/g.58505 Transcript_24419/m.58505 type:complete len:312 (+) Transcript_24419:262-1197(+)